MVRYYGKLSSTIFMVACSSLSPALKSQWVHMVRERLSGRRDGWAPVSASERQSCVKPEIVHTRQWEVKITSPSTLPSVHDSSPPGWNPAISAPKVSHCGRPFQRTIPVGLRSVSLLCRQSSSGMDTEEVSLRCLFHMSDLLCRQSQGAAGCQEPRRTLAF